MLEGIRKGKITMQCPDCKIECKKRKTLPRTATRGGDKWFDYYQCPKCKVNFAENKKE
jgi:uncharacterized C2H2 Zn-finger protein